MSIVITDAEVEAAARALHGFGRHHHWWPVSTSYDGMDLIAREEFDAIVSQVIMAALEVRSSSPDTPQGAQQFGEPE